MNQNYIEQNLHSKIFSLRIFLDRKEEWEGVIDFEFTCVDNPNRDLEYLWVRTMFINKTLNKHMRNKFEEKNYFDEKAFLYCGGYRYLMIISNPRVKKIK